MVNGMVSMLAYLSSEYFSTGKATTRAGNDHPIASPYGLFKARDGALAVAPATNEILQKFLVTIGLENLLDGPEYKTAEQRRTLRKEINRMVNERMATDTQENWIERLNAAGVPAGKVLTVPEVLEDPQIKAQDMVIEVEHPGQGIVRMVGFPVKLSDTPCVVRHPAPELGAHTAEVLAEIGLGVEDIAALKVSKAVR